MRNLIFTVPGEPRGKGRPRFSRKTGTTYTPKETVVYENLIKMAFQNAFPDFVPTDKFVDIEIWASFPIPKSWSKKKQADAHAAPCPKKPDIDNILKAVLDGLNGVAYLDDSRVTSVHVEKYYSADPPGLRIRVEEW